MKSKIHVHQLRIDFSRVSKNLYFLMLFFTGFTGFAFSPPPVIIDPTPLVVCDSLNDGDRKSVV